MKSSFKYFFLISVIVFFSSQLFSATVFKVIKIDPAKMEVTVGGSGIAGAGVMMGDRFYITSGEIALLLEASFPMQTVVVCKILPKSKNNFEMIKPGMPVYRLTPDMLNSSGEIDLTKTGTVKKIGDVELVFVKGGTFVMGSSAAVKGARNDEKPAHKVTVDSLWIGRFEITQKQYSEIMGANPSSFKGDTNPVDSVSWKDALQFCERFSEKYGVTVRLPYEAEWEYACRAGTSSKFYWGNTASTKHCWVDNKTNPVGEKIPNAFGLYDMSGNIWEWCYDWYSEDYYSGSAVKNPEGPGYGSNRVLRGGSWYNEWDLNRSAYRNWSYPESRLNTNGFRIVVVP